VTRRAAVGALAVAHVLAAGGGDGTGAAPEAATSTSTSAPTSVPGHRALGRAEDGRFLTEGDSGAILVSRRPDGLAATPAQQAAARTFVDDTRAAAFRYPTSADAEQAGYRRIDRFHWVNASLLDDGRVADPEAIESLIYVDAGGTDTLSGAMYIADGTAHGPQLAGPLTTWHFHRYEPRLCTVARSFPVGPVAADGSCARGAPANRSPEMLHVWFDDREDPFSERMIGLDHAHGGMTEDAAP
jgi:hypothetical protein